jgi:hypothetical protein
MQLLFFPPLFLLSVWIRHLSYCFILVSSEVLFYLFLYSWRIRAFHRCYGAPLICFSILPTLVDTCLLFFLMLFCIVYAAKRGGVGDATVRDSSPQESRNLFYFFPSECCATKKKSRKSSERKAGGSVVGCV